MNKEFLENEVNLAVNLDKHEKLIHEIVVAAKLEEAAVSGKKLQVITVDDAEKIQGFLDDLFKCYGQISRMAMDQQVQVTKIKDDFKDGLVEFTNEKL